MHNRLSNNCNTCLGVSSENYVAIYLTCKLLFVPVPKELSVLVKKDPPVEKTIPRYEKCDVISSSCVCKISFHLEAFHLF